MARLPLLRQGAPRRACTGGPAWTHAPRVTLACLTSRLTSCPLAHMPRAHTHTHMRIPRSLRPRPPAPQVLKDIPLYVVTEEKIGLLGTREQAIRIAEELRADTNIAT